MKTKSSLMIILFLLSIFAFFLAGCANKEGTLVVTILNPEEKPYTGTGVNVWELGKEDVENPQWSQSTDSEGKAWFSLPEGVYSVGYINYDDQYESITVTVQVKRGETTEKAITLKKLPVEE